MHQTLTELGTTMTVGLLPVAGAEMIIFTALSGLGRLAVQLPFRWSRWIAKKSKADPRRIAALWMTVQEGLPRTIPARRRLFRCILIAAVLMAVYAFGRAAFERKNEEYFRGAYGDIVTGLNPGTVPAKALDARTAPASRADTLVRDDWPKEPQNIGLLKDKIREYRANAQWEAAISKVCWDAQQYIRQLKRPTGEDKRAIVFDIDETALSNWPEIDPADFGYVPKQFDECVSRGDAPAIEPTLDLYRAATAEGIDVFFISARREPLRKTTEANLKHVGYNKWKELILRPSTDHDSSVIPFELGARKRIAMSGYRIVANIGDQYSDLEGGYAERCFKIPNPAYYVK
jgi:acid phosphatase